MPGTDRRRVTVVLSVIGRWPERLPNWVKVRIDQEFNDHTRLVVFIRLMDPVAVGVDVGEEGPKGVKGEKFVRSARQRRRGSGSAV